MKKVLLLVLLFTGFFSYSQISFGPKHYGKPGKFGKETLDNFKKTTTIFVFSNVYEKEVYDNILKKSWGVTPYKIVAQEDFNPFDYQENYSFAQVAGFKTVKTTKMGSIVTKLYTYFDFSMYDFESINKKASKLNQKKLKKRLMVFFLKTKLVLPVLICFQIATLFILPSTNLWMKYLIPCSTIRFSTTILLEC